MCSAVIMSHVTYCSSDFVFHMEPHGLAVWVVVRKKKKGIEKLPHLQQGMLNDRLFIGQKEKKVSCGESASFLYLLASPPLSGRFQLIQAMVSALRAL